MIDGSAALAGVQNGMAHLRQQAHTVATENVGSRASTGAQVGMIASQNQVGAAVRTLQAEDQMLGSLLDVRA